MIDLLAGLVRKAIEPLRIDVDMARGADACTAAFGFDWHIPIPDDLHERQPGKASNS